MNDFLKQHRACESGASFARRHKTLAEAWDACERADWLIWAYSRKCAAPDNKQQLRLFACWCARQNWEKLTDVRSRRAIEVAEAFANGKASEEELATARKAAAANANAAYAAYAAYDAANAAYAAYDAANAAYNAAYNAADAANAAADAAYAAAANAANAAAAYAADAADAAAARSSAHKAQAVQFKTMIGNPFL